MIAIMIFVITVGYLYMYPLKKNNVFITKIIKKRKITRYISIFQIVLYIKIVSEYFFHKKVNKKNLYIVILSSDIYCHFFYSYSSPRITGQILLKSYKFRLRKLRSVYTNLRNVIWKIQFYMGSVYIPCLCFKI